MSDLKLFLLTSALILRTLQLRRAARASPPLAPRIPATILVGATPGEDRGEGAMDPPVALSDDLAWLRDDARQSPAVLRHIEMENVFTGAATAAQAGLRGELFAELKARMVETDATEPYGWGAFQYYNREEEGKAYTLHCRRPRGGGAEVVLCDENALAAGHEFCDVHFVEPSPSHAWIAVGVDFEGGETYAVTFTPAPFGGAPPPPAVMRWRASLETLSGAMMTVSATTCSWMMRTGPSAPIATSWARPSPQTRCCMRKKMSGFGCSTAAPGPGLGCC